MYQWITNYQWIIILCLLLFFIFFSINKKECFSVGGQGNGNDISISSNLFLKDVCHKSDDGEKCNIDSDCQSNICFYKYDGTKNINVSGVCKSGNATLNSLCVHDTKRFLTNNPNDDSVIIKNFNDYNPDYFCDIKNTCIDLSDNKQYIETYNDLYDLYTIDTSNLKKICESFSILNLPIPSNINCIANLQYGYCKSKDD
jgi:hypothetical protein